MNIKYIARVMRGMSFDKLNACLEDVYAKSGKNKLVTFFDILGCTLKYGAGYYDYTIFEFYNMKASQRKTYMTRMKNKKLMAMLNDPAYTDIFDKKHTFYEYFSDYLGRDFVNMYTADKETVRKFVEGKTQMIAKPSEGECGIGIEKIDLTQFKDFDEIYAYVTDPKKNFGVIEDVLIQHPEMSRLYPHAINCFRIVTLVHEGVPHVLYAVLKTGNNGNFVDNLENGGFACHFDLEKGEVCGPGHTNKMEIVKTHPATGVDFVGFKPPFVKETIEMVKKAALVVPQVKYIGWDVCITENGPAIVEGNNFAAYDFPQLPDEGRERVGLLKQIQDIGIDL